MEKYEREEIGAGRDMWHPRTKDEDEENLKSGRYDKAVKDSWREAREDTGNDGFMLYEGPVLEGDYAAFWKGNGPDSEKGEYQGAWDGRRASTQGGCAKLGWQKGAGEE